MKTKILTLIIGMILGVALSASVLRVQADGPAVDVTAESLKKIAAQNAKLIEGQEVLLKDVAAIKTDLAFLKARSNQ